MPLKKRWGSHTWFVREGDGTEATFDLVTGRVLRYFLPWYGEQEVEEGFRVEGFQPLDEDHYFMGLKSLEAQWKKDPGAFLESRILYYRWNGIQKGGPVVEIHPVE